MPFGASNSVVVRAWVFSLEIELSRQQPRNAHPKSFTNKRGSRRKMSQKRCFFMVISVESLFFSWSSSGCTTMRKLQRTQQFTFGFFIKREGLPLPNISTLAILTPPRNHPKSPKWGPQNQFPGVPLDQGFLWKFKRDHDFQRFVGGN